MFGIEAPGQPQRRRAGLVGDIGVRLIEALPDDDDSEGEQHREDHAESGELEARNFIVGAQIIERDAARTWPESSSAPEERCR